MKGLLWRLVLADMTRLGYVQLNTRMTGVIDSKTSSAPAGVATHSEMT